MHGIKIALGTGCHKNYVNFNRYWFIVKSP